MMNNIFKTAAAAAGIATMIAGAVMAHGAPAFDGEKLDAVLAAQPEMIKARYDYRHPRETLEFFGVAPGMTVVDTTAGEYYSRILLPYLGDEGALVGASYALSQREIEVLSGLCRGQSNKEIARDLELQEVTIKLHVRTLCKKLNAKNRTQAALIAKEAGFE